MESYPDRLEQIAELRAGDRIPDWYNAGMAPVWLAQRILRLERELGAMQVAQGVRHDPEVEQALVTRYRDALSRIVQDGAKATKELVDATGALMDIAHEALNPAMHQDVSFAPHKPTNAVRVQRDSDPYR